MPHPVGPCEGKSLINIIYIMVFEALLHLFLKESSTHKLLILMQKLIHCHNNYVCHNYILLCSITVIVVAIIMLLLFIPLMT